METTSFPPGAPPPLMPPPVIAPQPPPPPRKSRGWMIFAIVLLILLAFSWFIYFSIFARALTFKSGFGPGFTTSAMRTAAPRLDEYVTQDNHSRNKIAVITVNGIITSHSKDPDGNSMVDIIKAQLDRASDDHNVRAVILKVDSPGGEVMASDQINKLIVRFQKISSKPVICSMGSLAASGGYYISAPCRWIVADDLTLTGSIGVIMEGLNYRGLMDKIGLQPMVYKSGKYKDMLSGMRETNDIPAGEHEMVQNLIDETFQKFKAVVRTGRTAAHEENEKANMGGRALATDWESVADGRVLSGEQALKYGFVDEIGGFDTATDKAMKLAGIRNANIVEYRQRHDLSDFLSLFGESSKAHDIKLDLGIEAPKLQAGERYFLWLPPAD
ncbi:MAG TPA: signal peptide peptidase SppA [Verrucomicrobiae bacterium]|nr:signal peptide peptidase SppA [Verrucomicrobiae bacterium]